MDEAATAAWDLLRRYLAVAARCDEKLIDDYMWMGPSGVSQGRHRLAVQAPRNPPLPGDRRRWAQLPLRLCMRLLPPVERPAGVCSTGQGASYGGNGGEDRQSSALNLGSWFKNRFEHCTAVFKERLRPSCSPRRW